MDARHTARRGADDVRSGIEEVELIEVRMFRSITCAGITLETVKVLTTMTMLAAITASKAVMLKARMTFRIIKPGPAKVLLENFIVDLERRKLRKPTVSG